MTTFQFKIISSFTSSWTQLQICDADVECSHVTFKSKFILFIPTWATKRPLFRILLLNNHEKNPKWQCIFLVRKPEITVHSRQRSQCLTRRSEMSAGLFWEKARMWTCGQASLRCITASIRCTSCRRAFHSYMSALVDRSSCRSRSQILTVHHWRRSVQTRSPREGKKEEKKLVIALTSCGKHVGMATLPARLSLWSPPNTRRMSAVWQIDGGGGSEHEVWRSVTSSYITSMSYAQQMRNDENIFKDWFLPHEDLIFWDLLLKQPVGGKRKIRLKVRRKSFIFFFSVVLFYFILIVPFIQKSAIQGWQPNN